MVTKGAYNMATGTLECILWGQANPGFSVWKDKSIL
jgi:hypothetical protein